MARRRREMSMVETLIMDAAIRPRALGVKTYHLIPRREQGERTSDMLLHIGVRCFESPRNDE
jgi:hypothetical protein